MRTLLLLTLTATALCVSDASAEALNPKHVAGDAEWVMHLDVESLVQSRLGTYVLEHQEELGMDLDLHEIEEELGLDPLEDLRSITLYGIGEPDESTVGVLTVTERIDELVEEASADTEHYRRLRDGKRVIHVWEEDEETIYFHVRPGIHEGTRIAVISGEQDTVSWGIDVLEGKTPSLHGSKNPRLTASPRRGSFIFAAADTLHWLDFDEDDPAYVIAQRSTDLSADIGESGDTFYTTVSVAVNDERDAKNVADVAQGLIALGRLIAESDPHLAEISECLDAMHVEADGNGVDVNFEQPVGDLIEQLEGKR